MISLFSHLKSMVGNDSLTTTYHIGLLHTKVFKIIMGKTSELLSEFNITNSDWVALGLIYDHTKGLRSLDLAELMGIEQAYITVVVNKLVKMGYLQVSQDPTDHRAKIIHLTSIGKSFVKKTEKIISNEMDKLSEGISLADAESYFRVQKELLKLSEASKV